MSKKSRTEIESVVVANSFDVSAGRLPDQAITLEDYRRVGGVIVRGQDPDASVATNTVTSSRANNYTQTGLFSGYDSHRNNHAIVVSEQPE